MTGAPAALAVRATPLASQEIRPKGLGGASLPNAGYGYGLTGGPHAFAGPRIQRQWTMAKNTRDTSCQVLPFLLDISLALYDTLDLVKASVDSEVVFQATLQVPAHHALACRMQAYGTPFAAPDLQAAAGDLADADLEFAACIAAPPDLDEQMSMNIGRVLSMLEHNREAAGQVARAAPAQTQQQAPSGGGAASAAQQLRASNVQAQQQAPKVLVSVDDAEAGSAQLQRANSAKKQPKFLSQGLGKRAMQALLGFGYLLTVLHEKHLGGHIQFTASALTAAASSTPSTGSSHTRHHSRSTSKTRGGMLAGLRQMVQECPSLSPGSFIQRSTSSSGGGVQRSISGAKSAGGAAAAGQEGLVPMTPGGLEQGSSFEVVWERISNTSPPSRGHALGLALQLSLSAPLGTTTSSSLVRVLEEEMQAINGRALNGSADDSACGAPAAAAAAAADAASLSKIPDMGRDGVMEALLDDALQQLAAAEPIETAANGLLPDDGSSAAVASAAAAAAAAGPAEQQPLLAKTDSCQSNGTPFSCAPPLHLDTAAVGDAVRSHFLPDQGCLTSPLPSTALNRPTAWHLSNLPNQPPLSLQHRPQLGSTPGSTPSCTPPHLTGDASGAVTPPAASPHGSAGGLAAAGLPPRSPTVLRPMMSMRLTCQPKWQYNEGLEVAGKPAAGAVPAGKQTDPPQQLMVKQQEEQLAPQQQQQQQQKRQAVYVQHAEEAGAPAGLWPTPSFSLLPVHLQPSSQQRQRQPVFAGGKA